MRAAVQVPMSRDCHTHDYLRSKCLVLKNKHIDHLDNQGKGEGLTSTSYETNNNKGTFIAIEFIELSC